ncbi:MAG: calcium/sodium antiporter [Bacteroidetes bacterium]|nr:calcium/sodium antiporter [Bacteroidota bacterium]
MTLNVFLLILGFVLLIKGADLFVTGSSAIGHLLHIPQIVIGLTIVALGTSLPELFVNIIGSISQKNDIVLGNILGSNIFNILIILGISAIIFPVKAQKNTIWKEIPFVILVSVILFVLANDSFFGGTESEISRGDGIVLFFFLMFFFIYLFTLIKDDNYREEAKSDTRVFKIVMYILLGLTGLIFGADLIVGSAVEIAGMMGISEKLIAITIISAGTGLPEFVTSVVASYKKNSSIALGNIVGSNILNILIVVAASSVIYPVKLSSSVYWFDFSILILCSFILFFSMFVLKKAIITRTEGVFFVLLYIFYILFNIYQL